LGASFVEHRQVEPAEAGWVGEEVDGDDPAVGNREGEDDARLPAHAPHGAGDAVDQRQPRGQGASP
jgi:hypothetical protein